MDHTLTSDRDSPIGVRARGLAVTLGGRRVLGPLDLDIDAGVVAVVGGNGAGKSTLLRALAGLVATEGSVEVGRPIGYLPAEPRLVGRHTVEDAVTYAAWLQRVPPGPRAAAVDAALDAVDLRRRRGARCGALSTGLARRVALAQVLVHDPRVLLLDEPTAAIDPAHRHEQRRLLRELGAGRLILVATHLAEDLELAATDILVLRDGHLAWRGSPAELGAAVDATVGRDRGEGLLEAALRGVDRLGAPS